MPGREGDTITDPILTRCSGCGKSGLECEIDMDRRATFCCGWLCTHIHPIATLARYGLLER